MVQLITPKNNPLFSVKQEGTSSFESTNPQKISFFQEKKKLLIIISLLLFIVIILWLTFFFLGSDYSKQLAEKSSLFVPFLFKD